MKKQWFLLAMAALTMAGVLGLGLIRGADGQEAGAQEEGVEAEPVIGPSGQPIAFPHNTHAGEFQIDCQYCHFSAERASPAGIPPVATCMGCHTVIAGSENPEEVARLRGYAARGEAIPWNRIYKVADHVQFPHMRHIAGGVDCTACHGNVAEIGVIQEVNQPLTMGWCLNCHLEMGASRDCTVCHY
jgi:hypothetical protein